jgi:hypothetical protein
MKNVKAVFTLVLLTGCENSVKGAKGETPAKFVSCPVGEKGRVVSVRFEDLDRRASA